MLVNRESSQARVRRDPRKADRYPTEARYSEAEGPEGSGEAEGAVSTA